MATPVLLPPDIVQVIDTIKAANVEPNDFNRAVQECFNRGYGKQGTWIMEHKELYLKALQEGYEVAPEGVPNPESKKNVVPPTSSNPDGLELEPVTPEGPPLPGDYRYPDGDTDGDPAAVETVTPEEQVVVSEEPEVNEASEADEKPARRRGRGK